MYGFIYLTTNNIDNKKYIGQKSYNVKNWEKYLGSGIYLKRAIKKYGKENFTREIIDEAYTKEELDEKEQYWIKYYNAVESPDFYNIASGGDGGNVIAGFTLEQKEQYSKKLSEIRKGVQNVGCKNGNAKRVICLNTMTIYETISEAAKMNNIHEALIQQCCSENSRSKTAGLINGERGIWEYYVEGKEYTYIPYKRVYKSLEFPVYCINTKELFINATQAGKKYNINPTSIRQCCNGKLLTAGKHPDTNERLLWCLPENIDSSQQLLKNYLNSKIPFIKKRIKCINTGEIFNTVIDAFNWCGATDYNNLKKKLKSDGYYHYKIHPITKEPLMWEIIN